MARAYAFCVGDAPLPAQISFYIAVREFGVMAITGRSVLTAREVKDCFIAKSAERMIHAFRRRKAAKSQSEWDLANKDDAALIITAQQEYIKCQQKSNL